MRKFRHVQERELSVSEEMLDTETVIISKCHHKFGN